MNPTLSAGGMVPLGEKLAKDEVVDVVVARAYRHAALPGRTVIRLTAEGVAAGDDLEMATLGFSPGEDRGKVARERKRPLGFPGWALVHDPKRARHALAVVKELKQQARKAKSKPGHAKEGFDRIGAKLGKTVPHFLPSFFEEAGRVFIEHGAVAQAAMMFGKAREAEAVHALEVDEQHRRDGFLEFALAGAITTKALAQYAKDLADHHAPAEAYAHFRRLCVQRTLGGMPPWSGMAKELGRLAKAAKLDPKAEDAALVAEIIESPALVKAATEFWRAYAEPITELARRDAAARGALLQLFPTGSTYSAELDDTWLDLLEASGAIEDVIARAPAAWFDKLTAHLGRDYYKGELGPRAFALLRRMAPALIAGGVPIHCSARRLDLDLAELALELGVPVAAGDAYLRLEQWAGEIAKPERGRDPVRVAAHPQLGPILAEAVGHAIGSEPFDTAARGKQGFLAAKRSWLEAQLEVSALPGLAATLAVVNAKVKAELFAELPDLHARFAALDVAPALARTLRTGIFDELGWPAFEGVVDELGTTPFTVHGGPPAVIVATATRVIAFDATGTLATHDLVIPPTWEFVTARFVAGEFLVVLKTGVEARCYWSSSPRDLWHPKDLNIWTVGRGSGRAVVLADGAWLEGARPIRPGDRAIGLDDSLAAFDGATTWQKVWAGGEWKWRELSASGEPGRASWPTFVEAFAEADWKIDVENSRFVPAPAGVTSSPLGLRDGFVGMRARYREHQREHEAVDGARFATRTLAVHGLLQLPANPARLPITLDLGYAAWRTVEIYDPTGTFAASVLEGNTSRYLRGQPALLVPAFWHAFVPRDEAGSRRLRAITDDDARALLGDANVLPEVTHPRLRRGIAGIVEVAVEHQQQLRRLAGERAPGAARAATSVGPDDATIYEALGGWIPRQYQQSGSAWVEIERAAELFAASDRSDREVLEVRSSSIPWFDIALEPNLLVFVALAIGTEQRAIITALLAQLARLPNQLRTFTATLDAPRPGGRATALRWSGGNAYVCRNNWNTAQVLEYAPTGVFAAPPGCTITGEVRGGVGLAAGEAAAVAAAVAEGKTSWSPHAAARLATLTGLTPSEATFLWAGCPNANDASANFLPKALREALGLKAAQAAIARDGLAAIPLPKRRAAIAEAGTAGVAALLDGSAVDRLADGWLRRVGKRVPIPEELVEEAGDLAPRVEPSIALAMIAGGKAEPQLTTDGVFAFAANGEVILTSAPEPIVGQTPLVDAPPSFHTGVLRTALAYIPFIYEALPVGHELRSQAAVAYDLVLSRLRNPHLWIGGGDRWFQTEQDLAAFDRAHAALGGEPLAGFAEHRSGTRFPGAILVRDRPYARLQLHPATLDATARVLVDKLAAALGGSEGLALLDYARSDDLLAIAARITKTPVPSGGWEQNPLASAPKLVDKVAKHTGVSRDAAALYLQFLVLLCPTAKRLAEWNGWTAKQVAAATAELVESELLVEAKRERAQRGVFLPGGWEALKAPHPPLESWKLPFYGARIAGEATPRFDSFQVLAPFHQLFERAWKRIEAGDLPTYEKVKR